MTTAKHLFLQRAEGKPSLADWWVTIAHDPRFEMVVTYARAHISESVPEREQLRGAELALGTLLTLSDNEPEGSVQIPSPGLHHSLDPEPKPKES